MSEVITTKRLSKVAREFNLGLTTIVEFLRKKGYDVIPNPNSKVSEEQYNLLLKEYSSEISVKKESEKISLRIAREKKDPVSIEDESKRKPAGDEAEIADNDDEVFIKDSGSKKTGHQWTSQKPAKPDDAGQGADQKAKPATVKEQPAEAREPEKKESSSPGLKIVGKLDLDSLYKKSRPDKQEEIARDTAEKDTEAKKEEVKETKREKLPEKPVEGSAAAEPSIEKIAKERTDEDKHVPALPKIEAGEKAAGESLKEKPSVKTEEEKPAVKPAEEMERERTEATEKAAVEPWGMIPSEATSSGRPPDQKQEVADKEPAPDAPGENIFKHKIQKLTGPTVVGKIDLPEKAKKKPVASSSDAERGKKKKRKRIRKDFQKPQEATTDTERKPDQATGDLNKQKARKSKKRPVRNEISEEDVQKQIKDTLSRLTSKGKSKGSKYRRDKREMQNLKQLEESEKQELDRRTLKVTEFVTVNELANMMDVPVTDIISSCMSLGLFVSINQRLDAETIALVAEEYDFKTEFVSADLQDTIIDDDPDDETQLTERPPIVTVMGHVDHGKTSLLDFIRHANVIAGEAGGITQHIGAYNVELDNGKTITFLDTPGHEAFTAMRARGAKITDIAIIVIAADDSVMPQTIEAINHAHAAGVPIVFAINKMDKHGANPEKIKEQLANMNFLTEDWGGKYQVQEISAKNGDNVELLLEKVLLEAEILELKANPNKKANGTVIESELDKGRGYITTVLVQSGTLKMGDIVLAGTHYGHVKAMHNERGKPIREAGPATPALLLGLNGAAQAGDNFNVMSTDKEARDIANKREQLQREQGLRTQKHITLDEIGRRIAIGNFQELNIIVKGDVDGSIEALSDSLIKLSTEEIQVRIIHKAVGQISESDILLAAASNAIVVGFQVRPSMSARKLAEKEEIDIRLYSIIYNAINEIKSAMEGMLSPEIKEEIVATLEVRETFKITRVGTVAGCFVKDGKINRNTRIRLIRDGIVVHTGELGSLKRFKEDVREVSSGYECGLNISGYNDIKVGDIIEGYREVEYKKTL
jgi:translation initiation factor IF-2